MKYTITLSGPDIASLMMALCNLYESTDDYFNIHTFAFLGTYSEFR